MLALSLVDIRVWMALAYPVYGLALLLLIAVAIPGVGYTALGATRWLNLGFTRLQPSEIMKVALVLGLARYYHAASARDARFSWKLIIPVLMIGMPELQVAHQPDLGTAMLLALTGLAVMFMAGLSWKIILTGLVGAAVSIPPFIM